MSEAPLGVQVTGFGAPGTPERPAAAWLAESRGFLALLATRDTYIAQPALWELGEYGRARTLEDFTHHLHAAGGTQQQWDHYLAYCLSLFDQRGFPFRWLTDAFATLARLLAENLPESVAGDMRARLAAAPAALAALAAKRGIDLGRTTRYDADATP